MRHKTRNRTVRMAVLSLWSVPMINGPAIRMPDSNRLAILAIFDRWSNLSSVLGCHTDLWVWDTPFNG